MYFCRVHFGKIDIVPLIVVFVAQGWTGLGIDKQRARHT